MAIVDINIIKEWFKNLKKPTQEQFWTWMDSFYHKWEGIPISGITGLVSALLNKADLVNGVVPESQLPFTINTNEVVAIGAITVTTNNVHIGVHESGSNKVRINGQILERSFANDLPFVPVIEGNKFLRIVARNEPGLFFLKQSAESDEPQEPAIDPGEVHVRLILITPDGSYIDPQLLNGFKTKAEDTWRPLFSNKLGNYAIFYGDERTCFSLEENVPSSMTRYLRYVEFAEETTRDVEFTIKNNTLGNIIITNLATDGLIKGFSDNTPFTIPSKGTVFVKYNHVKNVVEILKVGSSDSITSVSTDATLKGTGTVADPVGLSVAKNAEIANKITKTTDSITSPTGLIFYVYLGNADNSIFMRMNLTTYMSNYVTTANLTSTLASYVTNTSLSTLLNAVSVVKTINSSAAIDTTAKDDSGIYGMHGRTMEFSNGANSFSINLLTTAESNFEFLGVKIGTGNISIVAGAGVTLALRDYTEVVSGLSGSTFMIRRVIGTNTFHVFINNYE